MIAYTIFCKKVASKRYRVSGSYPSIHDSFYPNGSVKVLHMQLAIKSPRDYRRGTIINPTKVIKSLIAARRATA